MELSAYEMKVLTESPEALRLLSDWHDSQATQADAMGYSECVPFHESRSRKLDLLADTLQCQREGWAPETNRRGLRFKGWLACHDGELNYFLALTTHNTRCPGAGWTPFYG